MKYLKTLAALCFLFVSLSVVGQRSRTAPRGSINQAETVQSQPFKSLIHIMPLSLTVGGLEAGFEKPISPKQALKIDAGVYLSQNAGALKVKDEGYSDMSGFRTEVQYRFYKRTNNHADNLFIGPYANVKTISAKYQGFMNSGGFQVPINTIRTASSASFGYLMGFRNNLMENIFLDFYFGGGINLPVSGNDHEALNIPFFSPYQKGTQLKGGFSVVIALK